MKQESYLLDPPTQDDTARAALRSKGPAKRTSVKRVSSRILDTTLVSTPTLIPGIKDVKEC